MLDDCFIYNIIVTISVWMPVFPHGTARLPLDGFSLNLIFEDFSKTCSEKSSVITIWQEKNGYVAWRPTYIDDHISLNYPQSEKCFEVVVDIKTLILCPIIFFPENCDISGKMGEKYGRARVGNTADNIIIRRRIKSDLHAGWLRYEHRHTLSSYNM